MELDQGVDGDSVDGQNPALPIVRNIPKFPQFRLLKVMQDFVHQPFQRADSRTLTLRHQGFSRFGALDLNQRVQIHYDYGIRPHKTIPIWEFPKIGDPNIIVP